MSDALPLQGPDKADCGCGCGRFGRPNRNGCVRGCGCRSCIGRRNRRKGLRKQSEARRKLGVAPTKFGDSNEERWADELFANEVKAGKQCGPLANWWRRVEAQVQANAPDFGGRHRPTRAVAMPEGWSDGLVVVRLSTWEQVVRPALEAQMGGMS